MKQEAQKNINNYNSLIRLKDEQMQAVAINHKQQQLSLKHQFKMSLRWKNQKVVNHEGKTRIWTNQHNKLRTKLWQNPKKKKPEKETKNGAKKNA